MTVVLLDQPVDQEGRLSLTAEDGRNITVEYSDSEVRDALRMIDFFGDEVNLSGTVDPLTMLLDGDISGANPGDPAVVVVDADGNDLGITVTPVADATSHLQPESQ